MAKLAHPAAFCNTVVTTAVKAKFHYAILVADSSEAGHRPAASWNLTYHLAREQRASRSATSLGPVCDQDSLKEFSFDSVCDQIARTWLQTSSQLV